VVSGASIFLPMKSAVSIQRGSHVMRFVSGKKDSVPQFKFSSIHKSCHLRSSKCTITESVE
jgi:hypothetical protein